MNNNGILLMTMTKKKCWRYPSQTQKWNRIVKINAFTHKMSMFIALHCFMIKNMNLLEEKKIFLTSLDLILKI